MASAGNRCYTGRMTPGVAKFREPADAIVSRFTTAWVEDKAIERKKRTLMWVMIVFGAIGIGGIIVAAFITETWSPLLVTLVAAVPVIIAGRWWRAYNRLDIDNRKLETVLRVLRILRADIPSKDRVSLTVDLRNYDAAAAGQKTVTAVASGVSAFADAWFDLTARLADGNVVTLRLIDRIKRKTKRKGRIRLAARSQIRVGMRVAKQYRPAEAIAGRLRGRSAGEGLRVTGATAAAENRLLVAFESPRVQTLEQLPAGDATLRALASVYNGIAAVRQGG